MIIDSTGIVLNPGNYGRDCPGNGTHGECCCDECDYLMCCLETDIAEACKDCRDRDCPHTKNLCNGGFLIRLT